MNGPAVTPFCVWPAPNVNSVGATSRGPRAKIEGVSAQLKAGSGAEESLIFGKPKLIEGGPTVGEKAGTSIDPNIFFSYSCSCWCTPTLRKKDACHKDGNFITVKSNQTLKTIQPHHHK